MQLTELTGRARGCVAVGLFLSWLASCASDVQSEQEPIVGSGQIVEREIPVAVLSTLRIRIPFQVSLQSGEPKYLRLRGEDNLLDEIMVEEDPVHHWSILAPLDLSFTQHEEIAIEAPYLDMVELEYRENVRVIDSLVGSKAASD